MTTSTSPTPDALATATATEAETRLARNIRLLEAVGFALVSDDDGTIVHQVIWPQGDDEGLWEHDAAKAWNYAPDLSADTHEAAYWWRKLLHHITNSRFTDWPALSRWAHYPPDTPVLRVIFDYNGVGYCRIVSHRGQFAFEGYADTMEEAFLQAADAALLALAQNQSQTLQEAMECGEL